MCTPTETQHTMHKRNQNLTAVSELIVLDQKQDLRLQQILLQKLELKFLQQAEKLNRCWDYRGKSFFHWINVWFKHILNIFFLILYLSSQKGCIEFKKNQKQQQLDFTEWSDTYMKKNTNSPALLTVEKW